MWTHAMLNPCQSQNYGYLNAYGESLGECLERVAPEVLTDNSIDHERSLRKYRIGGAPLQPAFRVGLWESPIVVLRHLSLTQR